MMISQVLTDFKGAIRGNIGTEVQCIRDMKEILREYERHGAEIGKLISRLPLSVGMVESLGYNKESPTSLNLDATTLTV